MPLTSYQLIHISPALRHRVERLCTITFGSLPIAEFLWSVKTMFNVHIGLAEGSFFCRFWPETVAALNHF
jgi:hypothetical protein